MTVNTSQVQSLARDVREFAQQQSEQDLFEALRTAAGALDRPTAQLDALTQTVAGTPLGEGMVHPETDPISAAIDECLGHLGEEWDARALRDSGVLTRLRDALNALVESLEVAVSAQWREYLREHPIPNVGELAELLRTLDLDSLSNQALTIGNAIRRMRRVSESPYPTPEAFHTYVENLDTAQKGASRIGLDESWPDSVTRFLRSAASQGADLSELTGAVLTWLDEHGLAHHFRVVPRPE